MMQLSMYTLIIIYSLLLLEECKHCVSRQLVNYMFRCFVYCVSIGLGEISNGRIVICLTQLHDKFGVPSGSPQLIIYNFQCDKKYIVNTVHIYFCLHVCPLFCHNGLLYPLLCCYRVIIIVDTHTVYYLLIQDVQLAPPLLKYSWNTIGLTI